MFGRKQSPEVAGSKEKSQYVTGLPLAILYFAICMNGVLIILYLTSLAIVSSLSSKCSNTELR